MAAAGVQLPDEPGLPGATTRIRRRSRSSLEKVETLRYGENPHQPAARYRRPAPATSDGPFASNAPPLQGKTLSFNNVLDASAADALGRALRGPGVAIVKHTNPCGAAERPTLLEAWHAALEADPVSRVRRCRRADASGRPGSRRGPRVDLPRDRHRPRVRRGGARGARHETEPAGAGRPGAGQRRPSGRPARASRTRSARSGPPVARCSSPRRTPLADDASIWQLATQRAPSDGEHLDLDLAWRIVRGVTSNAIVLVRERRLIGIGSGQTSRVDAARQAVEKAHAMLGHGSTGRCRLCVRRLLSVPRRGRGLPRCRRDGVRPARRLDARRRGRRSRGPGRRHDAAHRGAPLPPLSAEPLEAARLTRSERSSIIGPWTASGATWRCPGGAAPSGRDRPLRRTAA